ncbi:hypothetical protein B0J13DRAFT_544372 [Dactylonectria estremocensis]|uniref:Uncharacterized protein n=1 Tax=Dactylonectria estremocensis TaxID=1079267 RepID=A0A9P9F7E1_9HYPO|nr:hypothetical protein B0J13DRAFT_544372 [Dactylonectria estremocensis]
MSVPQITVPRWTHKPIHWQGTLAYAIITLGTPSVVFAIIDMSASCLSHPDMCVVLSTPFVINQFSPPSQRLTLRSCLLGVTSHTVVHPPS